MSATVQGDGRGAWTATCDHCGQRLGTGPMSRCSELVAQHSCPRPSQEETE